jgi:hypothetical protein
MLRMNKNSSSFSDCALDEPIGQSKELLGVLFCVIVQVNVEIFKIMLPFCELF